MKAEQALQQMLHAAKALCVIKNEMVMYFDSFDGGKRKYDGYLKDKLEIWKKRSAEIDTALLEIEIEIKQNKE